MGLNSESSKDHAREQISGFVLAGGRSSRLGQDKVLLPWHGQTLLHHAIGRLQQVCGTVWVCADRKDLQEQLGPSNFLIQDAIPDAGPLAGIVAALEKSQTAWNFFLAVDLPLVPVELFVALAAHAESSETAHSGTLCILPQVEGLPQPLCGLYHRSLAPGLRCALEEGKYKIMLAVREAVLAVEGRLAPLTEAGSDVVPGPRPGPTLGTPASGVELFDVQHFTATLPDQPALQAGELFLNINTSREMQHARELSLQK